MTRQPVPYCPRQAAVCYRVLTGHTASHEQEQVARQLLADMLASEPSLVVIPRGLHHARP
jgi:hypothetical protein